MHEYKRAGSYCQTPLLLGGFGPVIALAADVRQLLRQLLRQPLRQTCGSSCGRRAADVRQPLRQLLQRLEPARIKALSGSSARHQGVTRSSPGRHQVVTRASPGRHQGVTRPTRASPGQRRRHREIENDFWCKKKKKRKHFSIPHTPRHPCLHRE